MRIGATPRLSGFKSRVASIDRPVRTSLVRLGGVAGVTAALTSALCGTASADLVDLQRVTAGGALDSQTAKVATTQCPPGMKVISAGGQIVGAGPGRVVLEGIRPDPTLSAVTVIGREATVTDEVWRPRAYAVCAPAAMFPDVQRVSSTASFAPGGGQRQVDARCPAGKQLIGAGGEIKAGLGQTGVARVVIDRLTLLGGFGGVSMKGDGPEALVNTWTPQAYAICASTQGLNLLAITHTSERPQDNPQRTTISCPTGARVLGSLGSVDTVVANDDVGLPDGQGIDDLHPDDALTEVTVRGSGGQGQGWLARATAICARPSLAPPAVS